MGGEGGGGDPSSLFPAVTDTLRRVLYRIPSGEGGVGGGERFWGGFFFFGERG